MTSEIGRADQSAVASPARRRAPPLTTSDFSQVIVSLFPPHVLQESRQHEPDREGPEQDTGVPRLLTEGLYYRRR